MPHVSVHERTPFGWVAIPPRSHRLRALWAVVPLTVAGLACVALGVWWPW